MKMRTLFSSRFFYLFLVSKAVKIVIVAGLFLYTSNAKAQEAIDTSAKQAYIIDYQTGDVLFAKNEDERMPTSSMSKVLTTYAVTEALKRGDIKEDQTFRVSQKAWEKQGSKMFVPINGDVPVIDLLKGVIIQSGNDASIVLAEGLAGSEDAFAVRLNKIAKDLGMENSNFTNASGWPDPEHYSTAKDLTKLAVATIKDHPGYYKLYSQIDYEYNGIKQGNRNPLLYKNIGADGIKTGHTEDAGYGLMASAVNPEGRRVVMVVNGLESQQARSDESVKLMTWALRNFKTQTIVNAGKPLEVTPVLYGKVENVQVGTSEDIVMTLPVTADESTISTQFEFNSPVTAPLQKGQKIGELVISKNGKEVRRSPLVTMNSVEEANFFVKLWQKASANF